MNKEKMIEKGIRAFAKYSKAETGIGIQASRESSGMTGDKITLRNADGVLAMYKVFPSGRIRRVA